MTNPDALQMLFGCHIEISRHCGRRGKDRQCAKNRQPVTPLGHSADTVESHRGRLGGIEIGLAVADEGGVGRGGGAKRKRALERRGRRFEREAAIAADNQIDQRDRAGASVNRLRLEPSGDGAR